MRPMPQPWSDSVRSVDIDLTDPERDRDVPIRVYFQKDPSESLPVIFVSHGIGESRESYEWLGRSIAAAGYAVIHPTHRGTDRAKLEEGWYALYKATKDVNNWRNRALDITFILDRMPEIGDRVENAILDAERVGVVGHSAGAWTAAAIAGLDLESGENLGDQRVDAIAPLSMPKTKSITGPEAWKSITMPALHMTGTCDRQIIWWTFVEDRRAPWENAEASDQFLLTLPGGRHVTFSEPWDPNDPGQSRLQWLTSQAVIRFLDAYVARDGHLTVADFADLEAESVIIEAR